MRSFTLLLSLTFLTTFGWTLHSSLNSLFSVTKIRIPSLAKNIKTIESLSEMNWSLGRSTLEADSATDIAFNELEKSFAPSKSSRASVVKNAKPRLTRVIRVAKVKAVKIELNHEPIVAMEIKKVEKLEDSFQFNYNHEQITENYKLAHYKAIPEFIYVAINEKVENVIQDDVKLAQAAPVQETKMAPEIKEEEIQSTNQDDDLLLQNMDEAEKIEAPPVQKVEATPAQKEQDLSLMEDDLNTYEYSAHEEKTPVVAATAGVSNNVSIAISREMQEAKGPGKGPYKLEKLPESAQAATVAYNQPPSNPEYSALQGKYQQTRDQDETPKEIGVNTHLKLRTLSFNMKKGIQGKLKDFEYLSPYDSNDLRASVEGEINLDYSLKNDGMKSLSLRSPDHIKTNFNVELLKDESLEMDVPLLNAIALEQFLLKTNREAEGGMLLIKLSPEVEKIGIDKTYSFHASLNQDMKAVKDEKDAEYVLYIGVEPGNALVSVKTKDHQFSYVSHILNSELTYDYLPFMKKDSFKVELFSEELMSKKVNFLNVMGDELSSFGTGKDSKKLTLNTYEFLSEFRKADSQNYFELKKGKMDLYFGVRGESKVSIPSETYQEEIMRLLNVKNPDESCVIQVNLDSKKALNSIRYQGLSTEGFENYSFLALDKDGSLGEDVSDTSSKLFFSADRQGVLNLELSYTDNSEESLQSFCSQGVYLIEQR